MHGHGACPLSMRKREKRTRREKIVWVGTWNRRKWKVTPNEDQRSKRARLLTRFQKGDPEGRRDHFHFDQKVSSKTQKNENENVGREERPD